MKNIIKYHLKELEIALNKEDVHMVLPNILDKEKIILDIGCGIGQTYLALEYTNKRYIGLDIDPDVIAYGIENYGEKIEYILSSAENIPLASNSIDLVFSRVSLPYTDIPKVLKEIKRVLKNDGRVWMTLHSKERVLLQVKKSIFNSFNIKKTIHSIYVLINGYSFKYFNFLFLFINGKYESWQDIDRIEKNLQKLGFKSRIDIKGKHEIIEGFLNE